MRFQANLGNFRPFGATLGPRVGRKPLVFRRTNIQYRISYPAKNLTVYCILSRTMDICMRKCCSRPNCDVAYLIDKNCFSVRCFSHELCKISSAPSITNGDVEISAMRRTVKKDELHEDSRK